MIRKYYPETILISVLFIITISLAFYVETPIDDAYIYLIYVKNLLMGNGLSFNGTIVEGYTGPLWVAMLSLLGLTGIDLFLIAQGLSLVFALGAVVLTYLYALKTGLSKWISFIPALLLAASGDMGIYALSGLETSCFVFFIMLSFYTASGLKYPFRSYALPLILSAASWTRPEGMFLTAIFFLALLLKSADFRDLKNLPYKNMLRFCSVYALTLLPLFIFRYIYYDGEFLPNTYYAKANAGLNNLQHGIEYIRYNFSNFSYLLYYIVPVIIYYLIKNLKVFLTEFLFLLCWISYLVMIGGDSMIGGRAFLSVYPVIFVLSVAGLKDLLAKIKPLQKLGRFSVTVSLLSGMAVTSFFLYNYFKNETIDFQIPAATKHARIWTAIGKHLKKNVPPDTLIAVGAAGMIPYYSELPTIDIFGLNDYHIAHYGRKYFDDYFAHQASDGAYVLSKNPDLIFLGIKMKTSSKSEIYINPVFIENYSRFYIPGVDPEFRIFASKDFLNRKKTMDIQNLLTLPYLTPGRQTDHISGSNVVKHDISRTYAGYNFFFDRRGNEAYLMDMEGNIVHTWTWPRHKGVFWQTVEMLPNGSIIIANLRYGLVGLDWDSNILWENREIKGHHDLTYLPGNTLITLMREFNPYHGAPYVSFDSIIHLDIETGKVLQRWSTFDNLEHLKKIHKPSVLELEGVIGEKTLNKYVKFLQTRFEKKTTTHTVEGMRFDYYHLNTIEVLPATPLGQKDDRFQQGNWMFCSRNTDLIVIIDKDTKEVVWSWGPGEIVLPHMPTMLENGNILIFDNQGNGGFSRVIELNPLTKRIVWEYSGNPPESFFTKWRGSAQRLPNGNTFILESDNGRAIEVTPDKEIVWEWFTPFIDPETDGRDSIYRMMRVEESIVDQLLKE